MKFTFLTLLLILVVSSVVLGLLGMRLAALLCSDGSRKRKMRLAALTPAVFIFTMLLSGLLINAAVCPLMGVSPYAMDKSRVELGDGCSLQCDFKSYYAFCDGDSVLLPYAQEIQRIESGYLFCDYDSIYRFDARTRTLEAVAKYNSVNCQIDPEERAKIGIEPEFEDSDDLTIRRKTAPYLIAGILAFCLALALVVWLWLHYGRRRADELPEEKQKLGKGRIFRIALLAAFSLWVLWTTGKKAVEVACGSMLICSFSVPQYELTDSILAQQLALMAEPVVFDEEVNGPVRRFAIESGLIEGGPVFCWLHYLKEKVFAVEIYDDRPDYYTLQLSPYTDTLFSDTTGAVISPYNMLIRTEHIDYDGMGFYFRKDAYLGCCKAGDAWIMLCDSFSLQQLCRPLDSRKRFVHMLEDYVCFCMESEHAAWLEGDSLVLLPQYEQNYLIFNYAETPQSDSLLALHFAPVPDDSICEVECWTERMSQLDSLLDRQLSERVVYPSDAPSDRTWYPCYFDLTVEKDGRISDLQFYHDPLIMQALMKNRPAAYADSLRAYERSVTAAFAGFPPLPPYYVRGKQVRYKVRDSYRFQKREEE